MTEPTEEFKSGEFRGIVLGELKSIREAQSIELSRLKESQDRIEFSLREFKSGIGERMEKAEKEISAIQGKTDLLLWILGKIATPILGAIGAGIAGTLAWQVFKR